MYYKIMSYSSKTAHRVFWCYIAPFVGNMMGECMFDVKRCMVRQCHDQTQQFLLVLMQRFYNYLSKSRFDFACSSNHELYRGGYSFGDVCSWNRYAITQCLHTQHGELRLFRFYTTRHKAVHFVLTSPIVFISGVSWILPACYTTQYSSAVALPGPQRGLPPGYTVTPTESPASPRAFSIYSFLYHSSPHRIC